MMTEKDADYELWLAMNEDVAEPVVEPVIEPAPAVNEIAASLGITLEQLTAAPPTEATVVVDVVEEESQELEFELSPSLIREPQTNSITIEPNDPLLAGDIITDSGEILKTGSIELPILTNTGSIPIIVVPEDRSADEALQADFADNYVSSIAPVRASGVMNSRARESVLPIKTRRGESQTVVLAVSMLLSITVGVLVIAAWLLKLI
ncbi:MAG: hypothetical protein RLZ71_554 [Actinomycetota bacterium]|jgi:hypothetical protein